MPRKVSCTEAFFFRGGREEVAGIEMEALQKDEDGRGPRRFIM